MKRLPLLSVILLTGCSALVPTEHKEQVAVKSAGSLETSHNDTVTKRSALPPIDMRGWGNKLDLKVPETVVTSQSKGDVDSAGDDSAAGFSISKQPLWVKLVGLAIGIGLLLLIWRWVKLEFPAVGKAAGVADGVLQREIDRLKTRAMATTDPTKLAEVNADIAHLTAEKGNIQR